MNQHTFHTLEFNKVLEQIANYARTAWAKDNILQIKPKYQRHIIEKELLEVEEAKKILQISSSVPIHSTDGIQNHIEQANKGLFLNPEQFMLILSFLDHCQKLKRFMKNKDAVAPNITNFVYSFGDMTSLMEKINQSIRNGKVDDHATNELLTIRRQMYQIKTKQKEKASAMLKSKKYAPLLQENYLIEREGQLVLSIKKEHRKKVNGTIVDTSSSGSTIYIEPAELAELREQLHYMKLAEEHEIEKILYQLTALFLTYEIEMKVATDVMYQYDFIFAKAKYSIEINGISPILNNKKIIDLNEARHPLLKEKAVPLTISFGANERALVITGPNTGGKTVTLKTVGLMILFAQSGIHVPAKKGTSLPIFTSIFVDIGDGQSIESNLSTFSSRLVNMIDILQKVSSDSLVLADELGSGTDPSEGMNLAVVLLKQLFEKGATLFATTHYSEMKEFADQTEGFLNASMEFDLESLLPTYKLLIGEAGKSQAFQIAHKLGLHPCLIEEAHQLTYGTKPKFLTPLTQETLSNAFYSDQIKINKQSPNSIRKENKETKELEKWNQGDTVEILKTGETAVVYQGPNEKGDYFIVLKGEKIWINHRRLRLQQRAEELYPEGYDFDILFQSKKYRKLKKQMNKRYVNDFLEEE
ncbi:putative ATPase [Bacillus sp. TS-2]|nr:putative ATPase [Bacillus sp. TS-2]